MNWKRKDATSLKNKEKEGYKAMVISIFGINAINMLTFVLCVLRIIAPEIIFGSINLTNQVGNSFGQLISYRLKMAGARPYFAKAEMQSVDEEPKAEAHFLPYKRKSKLRICPFLMAKRKY